MKTWIYLAVLDIAFNFGWTFGLAGHSWTKWFAAPAFVFLLGGAVRMF